MNEMYSDPIGQDNWLLCVCQLLTTGITADRYALIEGCEGAHYMCTVVIVFFLCRMHLFNGVIQEVNLRSGVTRKNLESLASRRLHVAMAGCARFWYYPLYFGFLRGCGPRLRLYLVRGSFGCLLIAQSQCTYAAGVDEEVVVRSSRASLLVGRGWMLYLGGLCKLPHASRSGIWVIMLLHVGLCCHEVAAAVDWGLDGGALV